MTDRTKAGDKRFTILFVLALLSLGPWLLMAFASLFAFDAPGSEENVGIWCYVVPIWIYPLFLLAALVVAFVLKHKGRARGARIALAVPLAGAAIFIAISVGLVAKEFIHDAMTSNYAAYSGRGYTKLPPKLFHRRVPVVSLDLSNNRIAVLQPEIGELTSLRHLNLRGNGLTSLPPELGNLTNLERLVLEQNQLTSLPPELARLTKLTDLNLSENAFTTFPSPVEQLTNLQLLYLSSNAIAALPASIGNLTNLQELYMNYLPLTGLPAEIGLLPNIQDIYLYGSGIRERPPDIPTNVTVLTK